MFKLVHTFEEYRDYEPIDSIAVQTPFGYLGRITVNDDKHSAYGSIANPSATLHNDLEIGTGDTVSIPWDEAMRLIETE
jgi:hypothetical protein